MPLHGLMFGVGVIATGVVALLGAAVQAIVFATRAPVGFGWKHSASGALGPLVAFGMAALAWVLMVGRDSLETRMALDDAWWLLPLVALIAWVTLTQRARAATRRPTTLDPR
jgi:hypothetical protein